MDQSKCFSIGGGMSLCTRSTQQPSDSGINIRHLLQPPRSTILHDFSQMAWPRSRQRDVYRLAGTVTKAFLVAFRTQAEIDHFHLIHLASINHNPCQQTVARRILFLAALKGWQVPKPAPRESKPVVPCHRPIVNFEHAQGNCAAPIKLPERAAPENLVARAWPNC